MILLSDKISNVKYHKTKFSLKLGKKKKKKGYNNYKILAGTRAVASLSLPGGQDKNISSIFPHFAVVYLIFPLSFFLFFLILVFREGSSHTKEGPGYATGWNLSIKSYKYYLSELVWQ